MKLQRRHFLALAGASVALPGAAARIGAEAVERALWGRVIRTAGSKVD